MNAKKAKAIRRAFRKELAAGSGLQFIAHPSLYVNLNNQTMLHFALQYVSTGGRKLVKIAKKIYKLSGLLPHEYGDKNG